MTCPDCNSTNTRPRTGTLGIASGDLWCTECGRVWTPGSDPAPTPEAASRIPSRAVIQSNYDRRYVARADASQLDRAGASIGHPRRTGETDEQFRQRLLS